MTKSGFLCICICAWGAEVSPTKCNRVVLGWPCCWDGQLYIVMHSLSDHSHGAPKFPQEDCTCFSFKQITKPTCSRHALVLLLQPPVYVSSLFTVNRSCQLSFHKQVLACMESTASRQLTTSWCPWCGTWLARKSKIEPKQP